jgi:hypothetical protein
VSGLKASRAKRIVFGKGTATDLSRLFHQICREANERASFDSQSWSGFIDKEAAFDRWVEVDAEVIGEKPHDQKVDVELAFEVACALSSACMTPEETRNLHATLVFAALKPETTSMAALNPIFQSKPPLAEMIAMVRALLAYAWGGADHMATKVYTPEEIVVLSVSAEQSFRALEEEL